MNREAEHQQGAGTADQAAGNGKRKDAAIQLS
jgi:hypothetical protein